MLIIINQNRLALILLKNYNFLKIAESIDELIIIDVSRDNREHDKFLENVSEITKNIFVPVCLGGGIRTLEYAKKLFESGADKINLNTSLFHDPSLVDEISKTYGAQAIIGHIDFRKNLKCMNTFYAKKLQVQRRE